MSLYAYQWDENQPFRALPASEFDNLFVWLPDASVFHLNGGRSFVITEFRWFTATWGVGGFRDIVKGAEAGREIELRGFSPEQEAEMISLLGQRRFREAVDYANALPAGGAQ